jgi:hypothetical protein
MLVSIQQDTGITPQALLDQPRLEGYLLNYWSIFIEISNDRARSESGPSPISSLEILAYFELWGVKEPEIRRDLRDFIKRADAIWLSNAREIMKAEHEKLKAKSKQSVSPPPRRR